MIEGLLDGLNEPFTLGEAYERALLSGYTGRLEAFRMLFLRQVKAGRLLRVARDRYITDSSGLVRYCWDYSDEARNIASEICTKTSGLRMSVFEIRQLNEFVNHLYGQNSIFISVADQAADFVFSDLQEGHVGRILLRPSPDEFYRYQVDGMIVLLDMPTEAPGCSRSRWQCAIEKWLVDLFAEPLLKNIVSPQELPNVLNGVFEKYAVNESALFRYAKRRNVYSAIKSFILGKTTVKLRTIC